MIKKFISGFAVSGLFLGLVFGMTGCSEEDPVSDSGAFLQKAVFNLLGTESLRFEADIDFHQSGGGGGSFEAGINGAYSYLDPEKEGVDLNIVAKIEDYTGDTYRFDVYLRDTEEGSFVKLLDLPEISNFPVALLADLVGPWWKLEAGGEGAEGVAGGFVKGIFGTPVEELEGAERQKRELILVSEFFGDIEFEGTESVGDYDAYRYSVGFNPGGISEYSNACAEIDGLGGSAGIFSVFESLNFDGDLWVDPVTGVLVGIDGKIYGVDPDSGEEIEAEVEITVSDVNMPFTVDAPLEYEIFDLAAFFGAFFESGVMGGMGAIEPMDTVETKQQELGVPGGEEAATEPGATEPGAIGAGATGAEAAGAEATGAEAAGAGVAE